MSVILFFWVEKFDVLNMVILLALGASSTLAEFWIRKSRYSKV
jgi:hypothetical protein